MKNFFHILRSIVTRRGFLTGEKNLKEFIPKVMSHSIANERCVQATSKKVLVRKGYKNVHTALLQTQKSISFAPYRASKRHILTASKIQH